MKHPILFVFAVVLTLSACQHREKISLNKIHDLSLTEKRKYLNLEGKFEFVNPVKDNFHVLEVYCDVKTNGRSAGTISKRPDLNVKASVPFYIPFLLQIDKEDVDFDEKYDKAYDVSLDGYIRYEIEGEEETVSFKQDERVSIRSSKKKDENDIGDDAKKDKKKKKKKNNDDEVTV